MKGIKRPCILPVDPLLDMKVERAAQLKHVALVSTPWPLYSRPSIQLGALKAYLRARFPDLKVHALHVYLKVAESIGYKLYGAISERTWLAESMYAALLYPERAKEIEKFFYREVRGKPDLRKTDFKTLTSQVKDVSDGLINSVDWERFGLAGFSICLCQLTSSLYFINRIKQAFPNLPVVVGGSMFAGDTIHGLLQMFPKIDFVVNGEGELPLSRLVHHLRDSQSHEDIPPIPGLVTRNAKKKETPVSFYQMETLSNLPSPDYDDYFRLLETFGPEKTFFPTLPAEISRGCWWRRDGRDFLIIRHKRLDAEPLTHRLVGASRTIYLFCQRHRSLNNILGHFPKVAEDKIVPFLHMMVDKKLMFEENGNYLSLAVPVRPQNYEEMT